MKTVSVDLDSTLVDILTPWLGYANSNEKSNYTIKDVTSYNFKPLMRNFDYIHTDLYKDLKPIYGSQRFMDYLAMNYKVQIVTHTFEEHKKSKIEFIEKYFPGIDIICTNECKLDSTKDTFLIDDKLEHIEKHIDINNGQGIVYTFNNKYNYNHSNRKDIIRMGCYKEIFNYILRYY